MQDTQQIKDYVIKLSNGIYQIPLDFPDPNISSMPQLLIGM